MSMVKCNRLGCNKEATHHTKIPIGDGLVADAWFCDEHCQEGTTATKGK
jgi:hypothetical protein